MAENSIFIDAPRARVFEVLEDHRNYPRWVVGAQQTRGADPDWPSSGSRFRHRVGLGPLRVADVTEVEAIDPPRALILEARFRPVGSARVRIELEEVDGGTRVSMLEVPTGGPLKMLWNPLLNTMLGIRNAESLRRLKNLVEKGPSPDD